MGVEVVIQDAVEVEATAGGGGFDGADTKVGADDEARQAAAAAPVDDAEKEVGAENGADKDNADTDADEDDTDKDDADKDDVDADDADADDADVDDANVDDADADDADAENADEDDEETISALRFERARERWSAVTKLRFSSCRDAMI